MFSLRKNELGIVYKLTFKNNKKYIGATQRPLRAEIVKHINTARKKPKKRCKLYTALRQHGLPEWNVLYKGPNYLMKQKEFIDKYDSYKNGYNAQDGRPRHEQIYIDNFGPYNKQTHTVDFVDGNSDNLNITNLKLTKLDNIELPCDEFLLWDYEELGSIKSVAKKYETTFATIDKRIGKHIEECKTEMFFDPNLLENFDVISLAEELDTPLSAIYKKTKKLLKEAGIEDMKTYNPDAETVYKLRKEGYSWHEIAKRSDHSEFLLRQMHENYKRALAFQERRNEK